MFQNGALSIEELSGSSVLSFYFPPSYTDIYHFTNKKVGWYFTANHLLSPGNHLSLCLLILKFFQCLLNPLNCLVFLPCQPHSETDKREYNHSCYRQYSNIHCDFLRLFRAASLIFLFVSSERGFPKLGFLQPRFCCANFFLCSSLKTVPFFASDIFLFVSSERLLPLW